MAEIDIKDITDKFVSLTLKSPEKSVLIGKKLGNKDSDDLASGKENMPPSAESLNYDALTTSDVTENYNAGANEEELCKFKNENYHLKLALNEKEGELLQLKNTMRRGAYIEHMHKVLPLDAGHTMYVDIDGVNPEQSMAGSPTKLSISDAEIMTHFSGSPYKGKRAISLMTESSLATTNFSKVKKNHKFFTTNVLPYIQKSISILHSSCVFKDEAMELQSKFNEFASLNLDKDYKIKVMAEIFDDLLYLHRQTSSLLNRELRFKELSQRLEYLFTIFLDPREYSLTPQDHIDHLRGEILDTLIKLFDYKDAQITTDQFNNKRESAKGCLEALAHHTSNVERSNKRSETAHKLKNLEEGIQVCAKAMSQMYSSKTKENTEACSRPSTKSSTGILSTLSHFSNTEKGRLKESKESLEFIPIGYDEHMLNSKTPQRRASMNKQKYDLTPRAAAAAKLDENDPLQIFFQEQASYYDVSVVKNRK